MELNSNDEITETYLALNGQKERNHDGIKPTERDSSHAVSPGDRMYPYRDESAEVSEKPISALEAVCSQTENASERQGSGAKQYYLYLVPQSDGNTDISQAVTRHKKLAERIRGDREAKKFIDQLLDGWLQASRSNVFNALCLPSGTGKTQLAFSLPRDRVACVYFNLSVPEREKRQYLYEAFEGYMGFFVRSLKNAYKNANKPPLIIYGFLTALLKLLIKHPQLDLPSDLTRIRVSEHLQPRNRALCFINL
jgi:hypothetical protein